MVFSVVNNKVTTIIVSTTGFITIFLYICRNKFSISIFISKYLIMFLSGETFNKICHVSIYQRDNDYNYILFNKLDKIIYVNENNVLDDIISKKI